MMLRSRSLDLLARFARDQESEGRTADSAHDVCELRDVVITERVEELLRDPDAEDEYDGNGDLALFRVDERTQHDEHEDDAAGPNHPSREQERVEESSQKGCDYDHTEQLPGTVLFFEQGPEDQYEGKVAAVVFPARMCQDVCEQAGIEQQRAEIQACGRGEHCIQGLSRDDGVQDQNEQRKESKTQRHRRVERKLQLHSFLLTVNVAIYFVLFFLSMLIKCFKIS